MADQIIFFALATVIVFFSIMAVNTKLIIRAATYLLFVLLATAGLYLQMDYQFLAAVQVAVYAGGIMVLFIFSILLTNQPGIDVKFEKPGRMVLAGLASIAGLAICGHIIYHNVTKMATMLPMEATDMKQIGLLMIQKISI